MHRSLRSTIAFAAIVALASASQVQGASPSTAPSPTKVAGADIPSPSAASIPDGSWLLYAWYPQSLYLVRPDGSDRRRLDIGVEGEALSPAWSPDGQRIAFVLKDDATPNGAIWTANADGSDASMLYDGDGACDYGTLHPSWSPDGSRLSLVCFYINDMGGFADISVLDLDTLKRTTLVSLRYPKTADNPVGWSPDGSTLVFEEFTWEPTDTFVSGSAIMTVPATGGPITRLTDPSLMGAHPDWSPDGSLITFNTYDTGAIHGIGDPSNVYTIAPDGTGLRQVSTASTDGAMRLGMPFWSADGSRIWVSVLRGQETDSTGQPKNTLAWVDAVTGSLHEVGTEGKRFQKRPAR